MTTLPVPDPRPSIQSHVLRRNPSRRAPRAAIFPAWVGGVLSLLLLVGGGFRAEAATGGPDGFGYKWIDSAEAGLSYNFEDISGTGTVSTVSTQDDGAETINIGFAFNYYGAPYTVTSVCSNGFIQFGGSNTNYPGQPIPGPAIPNNIVAGWWDDLGPHLNGTVYYQTLGSAPNRRFIVQFQGVADLGAPASLDTFEFKLFEGSNRIEVHYQTISSSGNLNSIGIENAAGSDGLQYYHGTTVPPIGAGPFAVRYSPTLVTNTNNTGAGSLRQAITDVPAGGAIYFDPSLNGATITLGGTQLTIGKNLTIDASALVAGITVNGNNTSRVFEVLAGTNVALSNLTITLGNASTGAGINNLGTLELADCTISENTASGRGGGIRNEPTTGNLIFTRGSILNNTADLGGGISSLGGAIPDLDNGIELRNVTISGNSTTGGAGGGIFHQLSFVRLYSCTITDNVAATFGGGVHRNNSGDLHLENTLIANNDATTSGNDDLFGAVTTRAGVNFIGDPTGASNIGTLGVDYLTGDPLLGSLAEYGGTTQTIPPRLGSPVIDAGGTSDPGGTDQRGAPRFVNGALDIGAVEYVPAIVTTAADEDQVNPGLGLSLREALDLPFVSAVTFDGTMEGATCTLVNDVILIDKSVVIDGSNLARGFTLSGNDLYRIFEIGSGQTVSIDSLNFTQAHSSVAQDQGAAIYNAGTLTVRNSTFHRNKADQYGGALGNSGNLTVIGCTVADNSSVSDGGGINHRNGTLVIESSTICRNRSGGNLLGQHSADPHQQHRCQQFVLRPGTEHPSDFRNGDTHRYQHRQRSRELESHRRFRRSGDRSEAFPAGLLWWTEPDHASAGGIARHRSGGRRGEFFIGHRSAGLCAGG
jgi:hypothetical protein